MLCTQTLGLKLQIWKTHNICVSRMRNFLIEEEGKHTKATERDGRPGAICLAMHLFHSRPAITPSVVSITSEGSDVANQLSNSRFYCIRKLKRFSVALALRTIVHWKIEIGYNRYSTAENISNHFISKNFKGKYNNHFD